MKTIRKIIEIDEERCDGCGICVPACAEGAIQIIDGKAKLIADKYCDGLGACLGECPNDALRIIDREADIFDETAVEKLLKSKGQAPHGTSTSHSTGCPSAHIATFSPYLDDKHGTDQGTRTKSSLSHWPVQIRLVPPTAPFLKGADLLITSDCVPIACGQFHEELLKDKVVMMGCPKFDDVDAYVEKFTDIFRQGDVKSITVSVMEVPCCQGLPMIVEKALSIAGKTIPMEKVIISTRGNILKREKMAA